LHYVNPEVNPVFTPSGAHNIVPDATFRKLGRAITDHIGESENVFVLDAAVGSHRLGEVNVRVITNSANVNLYLKHMLPRQGRTELTKFQFDWTIYVAPDFKVEDTKSLGLKSTSFAVANLERAILFIAGTTSNQAIKEAIAAAVSSRTLNDTFPSLGLSSASVVSKNGKSALVIDPSNQLGQLQLTEVPAAKAPMARAEETAKAAKGKKKAEETQKSLFTAQLSDGVVGLGGAFWNHYGVFRMFGGITHNNEKVPRQRADIVEQIKSNGNIVASHITQPLKDLPNESPAPSALVFLISDQNALLPQVAKMSLAQASKFLSVGYSGNHESLSPFFQSRPIVAQPGQVDKLFQELATTGNTKAFVVNTKRKDGSSLTSQEIDQIISSATDGSLSSAPSTTDSVFKYEVISQVKGVKGNLDITQGWEKKEYNAQASKLASLLSA
jgi:ATP-dependent phosphoenolpyruvate carboxykinase